MVDWSLARQIARFAAGSADAPTFDLDLDARVRDAQAHVMDYTGIEPAEPAAEPEAVDRAEWAEVNLDGIAGLLAPVTERLDERLGSAGPLAGPLRMAAGATLAAEAGAGRRLHVAARAGPVRAVAAPARGQAAAAVRGAEPRARRSPTWTSTAARSSTGSSSTS